jgi:lipoprotein-anchoring transpeptidase ErfK/SrfK
MPKKPYILTTFIILTLILTAILLTKKLPTLNTPPKINPHQLTSTYNPNARTAIYNNQTINIPPNISRTQLESQVLGIQENSPISELKKIFIDLTNQRIYAFEDNTLKYNFLISSGKWGRTPTGTFRIWIKLKSTLMAGGSKALGTYYYLPNVPYTMYFYNNQIPKTRGYGIHGTYWHDNFGHPMSHGCINMKTEEVEQLFYWAHPQDKGAHTTYPTPQDPGTEITIFGTAPPE